MPTPATPASHWTARVFYTDGQLQAESQFQLAPDATEREARHRAWTIYHWARAGSDGSFVNPTLVVERVALAVAA